MQPILRLGSRQSGDRFQLDYVGKPARKAFVRPTVRKTGEG
jgi:hypothetical protein